MKGLQHYWLQPKVLNAAKTITIVKKQEAKLKL